MIGKNTAAGCLIRGNCFEVILDIYIPYTANDILGESGFIPSSGNIKGWSKIQSRKKSPGAFKLFFNKFLLRIYIHSYIKFILWKIYVCDTSLQLFYVNAYSEKLVTNCSILYNITIYLTFFNCGNRLANTNTKHKNLLSWISFSLQTELSHGFVYTS